MNDHSGIPLSYGSDAPYHYYEIEPSERNKRFELTSDLCIMDDEYYFIRGCLEIPILEEDENFIWDVWVSISKASYRKVIEEWNNKGRENTSPYFGWLATLIPGYPETLNLKTNVHIRQIGYRPFIELEPTMHPLALEQRNGIDFERVKEIQKMMQ
ncbi:hypothetical protein CN694_11410 [Bacillus wiedmannii]|uniref:DUF2199 domain-containing protein n=1 Tax=Bacillus wiedmannii TaxID=1890302 RepID=A0AB73SH40_9BACI|nr:DUF2199 domain-containing protein [Bacillus wiedmannii]PEK24987.1 hypothetical protein CN694_11410 [Bacillus wiedmannii]